jgi:hypothetical protein
VPSPGAGQEKELLIDLSKPDTTSSSTAGQAAGVHVLGKCDPEVGPWFISAGNASWSTCSGNIWLARTRAWARSHVLSFT